MATKKLSRSQQARINGAKSKGPTTAEGKAISSANSLKHGFASLVNVVLRVEDKLAFETHLNNLRNSIKPRDYYEQTVVDQLASITRRQARLAGLETALIDAQVDFQESHVRAHNPSAANDPSFHLVQAWQALARQPRQPNPEELNDPSLPPDGYDINSMDLLRRYQLSHDRQHRNALLNLDKYRRGLGVAQPAAPEIVALPNEPKQPIIAEPAPQNAEPAPQNAEPPTKPGPLTIVKPLERQPDANTPPTQHIPSPTSAKIGFKQ